VRVPTGNTIGNDFFLNRSTDLASFTSLAPADYSVVSTVNDGDDDIITIETDTAEPGIFYNISNVALP